MAEKKDTEVNLGFARVTLTPEPTPLDREGMQGLYVKEIRINWLHPKTWFYILTGIGKFYQRGKE